MAKKLLDKIPGNKLDNSEEIAKKIIKALNPNDLEPLELWKELKEISKTETINYYKENSIKKYYMLYTDYSKKETNYIFITEKENVINFIDNEFNEEFDEGFDIIISDVEFKKIIMGNHDGIIVTR